MSKQKKNKKNQKKCNKGFGVNVYNGVDKVNGHMYVAGDPMYCVRYIEDQMLVAEKVDCIVDCRSKSERNGGWDEEGLNIPVVYAEMHDDGRLDNQAGDFIQAWFKISDAIVAGELPVNPTFLVHCHMGVNRGPSMAMFLLMMEGMSPVDAFLKLRDRRQGVGVAYAEQAVMAWVELTNADPEEVQDWLRFERDYWTPARTNTVRNRVFHNRTKGVTVDARGIAHAER